MTLANFPLRRAVLPLLLCALGPAVARAEHASIDLQVTGPDGSQEASADQEPPLGGVNPRPHMTVKAGDPLVLQFVLTNIYPHGRLSDVSVRYFVVRTGKLGVKQVPELTEGVITRGTATFEFKPKCRVGARFRIRIEEPGVYMVRVDTLNTKSDHEHFSAIDLEVK